MAEKLKGSTKLSMANRPVTRKEQPKTEKLGLLSSKNRKMVSYRMRPETIDILHELTVGFKNNCNSKLTKSEILEMALNELYMQSKEEKKQALIRFLNKND